MLLLASSHAMNDAFSNLLPAFLPTLQAQFGLGETFLAILVAVISFSSNVLQAFAGVVADRWGRRRAAAVGLIAGSVLMSFIPVVPTVWALILVLAIGGLGSALFHPAAASMARMAAKRKGLALGLFTSGGPLGSAIMPVVALWLLRNYGPEAIPWLSVLGITLGIALFVLAPQQTPPDRATRPKFFDLSLFMGPVGLLAVAGILRAVSYISFMNAMPLVLVNIHGIERDGLLIGYTLAVFQIAASVGVIASGALEPRLGRRFLVVGAMLLGFPAFVGSLFVAPGSLAFYALIAVAGFMNNAPIPLLVVSAQDFAPNAVATASGMLMGFTWGIAGIAYIGFGGLQEAFGLIPALLMGFSFLLPAAGLSAYVLTRYRTSFADA